MKDNRIYIKSSEELDLMRKSGQISAKALKKTIDSAKTGITLKHLDQIAENEIKNLGGKSAFKSVPGYNFTTCLTVNDEVVHGIPRDITLNRGDKLSIDLGSIYKGWYTDVAWSIFVGRTLKDHPGPFLKVGEQALWAAIDKAIPGNHIGDISVAIQDIIEGSHFSVVRSLIGHGVGKALHEPPEIPGIGVAGEGLVLKEGMTLAIEVIYTGGGSDVSLSSDGWTVVTSDASLGGLFEMTIIVKKDAPEVITDWRFI